MGLVHHKEGPSSVGAPTFALFHVFYYLTCFHFHFSFFTFLFIPPPSFPVSGTFLALIYILIQAILSAISPTLISPVAGKSLLRNPNTLTSHFVLLRSSILHRIVIRSESNRRQADWLRSKNVGKTVHCVHQPWWYERSCSPWSLSNLSSGPTSLPPLPLLHLPFPLLFCDTLPFPFLSALLCTHAVFSSGQACCIVALLRKVLLV